MMLKEARELWDANGNFDGKPVKSLFMSETAFLQHLDWRARCEASEARQAALSIKTEPAKKTGNTVDDVDAKAQRLWDRNEEYDGRRAQESRSFEHFRAYVRAREAGRIQIHGRGS